MEKASDTTRSSQQPHTEDPLSGMYQADTNSIQQLKSGKLTPDAVIALQGTIGNQAVMQLLRSTKTPSTIQRGPYDNPGIQISSPVAESFLKQGSILHAGISGRPLTSAEVSIAQPVFGNSINFSQVRIIRTSVGAGTTIGNVIRMHEKYDVSDAGDAQTLIHELTHVWQFQHYGTKYISVSLQSQISATVKEGNRNHAYDYTTDASKKFFDFMPEQQGFIVENYHAMTRDKALLAEGKQKYYQSNHLGADGFRTTLTPDKRQAEINAELPIHETYIKQMQKAVPLTQSQLIMKDAQEVMQMPHNHLQGGLDKDRELTPLKPLVKFEF